MSLVAQLLNIICLTLTVVCFIFAYAADRQAQYSNRQRHPELWDGESQQQSDNSHQFARKRIVESEEYEDAAASGSIISEKKAQAISERRGNIAHHHPSNKDIVLDEKPGRHANVKNQYASAAIASNVPAANHPVTPSQISPEGDYYDSYYTQTKDTQAAQYDARDYDYYDYDYKEKTNTALETKTQQQPKYPGFDDWSENTGFAVENSGPTVFQQNNKAIENTGKVPSTSSQERGTPTKNPLSKDWPSVTVTERNGWNPSSLAPYESGQLNYDSNGHVSKSPAELSARETVTAGNWPENFKAENIPFNINYHPQLAAADFSPWPASATKKLSKPQQSSPVSPLQQQQNRGSTNSKDTQSPALAKPNSPEQAKDNYDYYESPAFPYESYTPLNDQQSQRPFLNEPLKLDHPRAPFLGFPEELPEYYDESIDKQTEQRVIKPTPSEASNVPSEQPKQAVILPIPKPADHQPELDDGELASILRLSQFSQPKPPAIRRPINQVLPSARPALPLPSSNIIRPSYTGNNPELSRQNPIESSGQAPVPNVGQSTRRFALQPTSSSPTTIKVFIACKYDYFRTPFSNCYH